MRKIWFKKLGWIYYPVSLWGVLSTALVFVFCAQVFIAVDRASHSVSDTLYGIFPYVVPAFGILLWIASNKSEKEG